VPPVRDHVTVWLILTAADGGWSIRISSQPSEVDSCKNEYTSENLKRSDFFSQQHSREKQGCERHQVSVNRSTGAPDLVHCQEPENIGNGNCKGKRVREFQIGPEGN